MAGSLLQYSGLVTKTRAMSGRLLTREEFQHIMELQTVHETIAYLREQESYGRIYGNHEEVQHRGQVEALIHNSILEDYESLIRFSGPNQRKALALYREQLQYGNSVPEIDTAYFVRCWKEISRFRDRKLRLVLREIFGTQIDWLNIMWMYRAKRFFNQGAAEIYGMLIPVRYRLKKEDIRQMAETGALEEFIRILGNTPYFKGREAVIQMQDEISYHAVMRRMYRKICQKYPASLAPVFQYLYNKEQEIENLTTALEGIRYQVPAKDIRALILNTM